MRCRFRPELVVMCSDLKWSGSLWASPHGASVRAPLLVSHHTIADSCHKKSVTTNNVTFFLVKSLCGVSKIPFHLRFCILWFFSETFSAHFVCRCEVTGFPLCHWLKDWWSLKCEEGLAALFLNISYFSLSWFYSVSAVTVAQSTLTGGFRQYILSPGQWMSPALPRK